MPFPSRDTKDVFRDVSDLWRFDSLRSRREWVPARTSVRNASAKSRSSREKNGEESSWILLATSPLAKIPSRAKPARELAACTRTHSRQLRRLTFRLRTTSLHQPIRSTGYAKLVSVHWFRVTSRPHRLMKTSSMQSKRRDIHPKVTASWDKQ